MKRPAYLYLQCKLSNHENITHEMSQYCWTRIFCPPKITRYTVLVHACTLVYCLLLFPTLVVTTCLYSLHCCMGPEQWEGSTLPNVYLVPSHFLKYYRLERQHWWPVGLWNDIFGYICTVCRTSIYSTNALFWSAFDKDVETQPSQSLAWIIEETYLNHSIGHRFYKQNYRVDEGYCETEPIMRQLFKTRVLQLFLIMHSNSTTYLLFFQEIWSCMLVLTEIPQ